MKKKISIIIPFFNERNNLPIILKKVQSLILNEDKYDFEILLMDNNSNDGSAEVAKEQTKNFKEAKYFKMSRNFGYQANIKAGYDNCTGDSAVQLDADGEDDPDLISDFLRQWENKFDVVYGIRRKRKEFFILTLFRSLFYKLIQKFSNIEIPIGAGDFRLIDRKVIDYLKIFDEKNLYLRGLISFIGFKQKGVEYDRQSRFSGESKLSLLNYFDISFTAFTSFTQTPLIIIFFIGLLTFLTSLILLFIYLLSYMTGLIVEPGFTTIILIQLLFFGLILFFIGIVSIYVGYILEEVKKRPTYIFDDDKNE